MKFVFLDIPLERRLQTLAIAVLLYHAFVISGLCIAFSIYLVLFTNFYWIPLSYAAWYCYDMNQDERGGRRWELLRKLQLFQFARDYFRAELVKTADLPNDRNYIFAHHPHGIICASNMINIQSDATDFSKKFPDIVPHSLTLRPVFFLPVLREIALFYGLCSASKKSIEWILTKKGKGNAAVIVVGGVQEVLDARYHSDYILTLKYRKGFVAQALQYGADLVPVFSFGENDLYKQFGNPPGSRVRSLQEKLKKITGITLPLINGRGIFQYYFGLLPFRKKLICVVGSPIRVEKVEDPTQEQIDELHSLYIAELSELYEKHRDIYGHSQRKLVLV